jgi:hypothetical protein
MTELSPKEIDRENSNLDVPKETSFMGIAAMGESTLHRLMKLGRSFFRKPFF